MKKRTNKKLALNKERISELSQGNLGDVKGGKPDTWAKFCVKESFGWKCWESELYTACHCEKSDWGICISGRACEVK